MNENQIRMFDLNNNIERVLDFASYHWRPAHYHMDVAMVAAERRDQAIASVTEAIEWFADPALTIEEIATLIVDQSDFALDGLRPAQRGLAASPWATDYRLHGTL